ncbi:MAG: class I adenylate-forming enzyme family protein [Bdellovibrionota bacterium]
MPATIVTDLLKEQAEKNSDRLAAIVDGIGEITYGAWEKAASRLGRKLAALGIQKGDRVGLLFSNREAIAFMVGYFAIHKAGGVAVPINTRLSAKEIAYILSHSEAKGVLSEPEAAQKVIPLQKDLIALSFIVVKGEQAGDRMWEKLLRDGDDSYFQVPQAKDDLCDILYTSGTTGFPKGVACSHENVVGLGGGGGLDKLFAGQSFIHAVPLFTFAGTHAMMMIPLRAGMTSVIQPKFDAGRYLELIAKHKVALTYAVPSMLLLLLDHPDAGKHDYSSLKMIMYGTAPMPPEGVKRLGKLFRAMLLNIYGLTEGGGAACSLPPHEAQKRPDSIGKPLPPTEVKIVKEDGFKAAPREVGEIFLRSSSRRKYFKNEKATSETWTEDGWLKTGDLGYLDDDGFLYIAGRNKDMIIRGGFNVYPIEIEAALHEHPAVQEAAVVGVPHKVLGEDVKAFVVVKPGYSLTADELLSYCTENLADYKCPRQIEFLKELPRNALGKVLKRVLRGEEENQGGTGLEARAS